MTLVDTLSLSTAVIAAAIAFLSLHRTGKLQKQQMRLNDQTEEISQWKLEVISRQKEEQSRALVEVNLVDEGTDSAIYLTNVGLVPARRVNLQLSDPEGTKSPFVRGDYESKIPIPVLNPGQNRRLSVARAHDLPLVFEVRVEWLDPDDTPRSHETQLAW